MSKVYYYDVGAVEMMLAGAKFQEPCEAELAACVQRLTERGFGVKEVAARLGIGERRVYRMRAFRVEPIQDGNHLEYDTSDSRANALEAMAILAMQCATEVRTAPHEVWEMISRMDPQRHMELTMALACLVPIDATVKSLLGWLDDDIAALVAAS